MSKEDLRARTEHNMEYHRPQHQMTQDAMASLREQYLALANRVIDIVPESRELSMALTDLETSLMNSIAGLARNEEVYVQGVTST